ncbi:universal stress protein [Pedobacter polysacchareus]|uniref:universal stress protein n=1 Tax=Pedobacter polysacchareus TaxID=2861973 RepID=UPI001C99A784|nr:universal stress protein [Pedobacter polysacchareus]
MKKIIIPTDFSVPAENAARYALALAKKLKADILLCNAFKVPAEAPMASQVAWPLMDYAEIKEEVNSDLDVMVKSLTDPSCSLEEEEYCPNLDYESGVGSVSEVVAELAKKEKADLLVMGIAGASGLTQFILGSNSKEMIEKATVPLLLVPYEAEFKKIRKIAFATDLNLEDLQVLEFLLSLASPLNAHITIVHITNKEVDAQSKVQEKIDAFFNKIKPIIKSSGIKYEYVWNIDVDHGLQWLAGQEDVDLIAIAHREHNLLGKIFKGSHTQKLSRHTKIPLLVFSPKYMEILKPVS